MLRLRRVGSSLEDRARGTSSTTPERALQRSFSLPAPRHRGRCRQPGRTDPRLSASPETLSPSRCRLRRVRPGGQDPAPTTSCLNTQPDQGRTLRSWPRLRVSIGDAPCAPWRGVHSSRHNGPPHPPSAPLEGGFGGVRPDADVDPRMEVPIMRKLRSTRDSRSSDRRFGATGGRIPSGRGRSRT